MSKYHLTLVSVVVFSSYQYTYAQTPEEKATAIIGGLEFGATTASSIYSLTKAENARSAPGDRYQKLAQEIAYQVDTAKHSSSLIRAPFDLISTALAYSSAVNPEPSSKTAGLVLSYGFNKFGGLVAEGVMREGNARAEQILVRALKESNISVDDLSKMPPEKFTATLNKLIMGNKTLNEQLKDYPEALARVKQHAEDLRSTTELATLKTVQEVKGDITEVKGQIQKLDSSIREFKVAVTGSLDQTSKQLKLLNQAIDNQSKSISALADSVKGNTKAIHSIAQISAMSWTIDQKIAALDAGLLPDPSDKTQRDALRASLEAQRDTERRVSELRMVASKFGGMVTIASNLGVDPKIVKGFQAGQLISTGIAAYFNNDFMGAAVAASSLLGLGKSGQDPNTALMSYMGKQFAEINKKLEEIIGLQKQTLSAVLALHDRLDQMAKQLDAIERSVNTSNIALQYLLLQPWTSCHSMLGAMNASTDINASTFTSIADDLTRQKYLTECYDKYSAHLHAFATQGRFGYGILDYQVFATSGVYEKPADVKHYQEVVKGLTESYELTRDFYLQAAGTSADTKPALELAALLSPKSTVSAALDRDQRIRVAEQQLSNFTCGDLKTLRRGIQKSLCLGKSEGSFPFNGQLRQITNLPLASPMTSSFINAGISFAAWSTFSFQSGATIRYAKTADIKTMFEKRSSALTRTLQDGRRAKLIEQLEWLADGYLLQQSIMYGDKVAQMVVDQLWQSKRTRIVDVGIGRKLRLFTPGGHIAPPNPEDPRYKLQLLAFNAMRSNETLARNVVLIALRKALTTRDGIPQTLGYSMGMLGQEGPDQCTNSAAGSAYLAKLLPNWTFTRAVTDHEKKAAPALEPCMTAAETGNVVTGFGVRIGDLFVKAPLPGAIEAGVLEQPPSLRRAIIHAHDLANEVADINARGWIPSSPSKEDSGALAELIASGCLTGNTSVC